MPSSKPTVEIIDAFWTRWGNLLILQCPCGVRFSFPANRRYTQCPECSIKIDMLEAKNIGSKLQLEVKEAT